MVTGEWHDAGSAAAQEAALQISPDNSYILQVSGHQARSGNISDVQVSARLGNVPRKLTFEDGSVFSTRENDAIDELFKSHNKTSSFVHALESKVRFALLALLVTVVVVFAFFKWGLPAASHGIANALPQKTNQIIGANSLKFLDEFFFKESKIAVERQREIKEHFIKNVRPLEKDQTIKFTLHFRDWSTEEGQGIANALALPSGDIIVTDEFIRLSQSQSEIDSVLLHEMGHIAHRHSLKLLVQSSIVTIAVLMTVGDVSTIADLGVGLGSLLITTSYLREFESEADQYAFDHMFHANMDPIAFASIMDRLSSHQLSGENKPDNESEYKEAKESKDTPTILDYLASHPRTIDRIEQAKRYSECFKQGLKVCEAK